MDQKKFYLRDKFNAQAAERAAVVLGYNEQQRNRQESEELFAIQTIHTGYGAFPTRIYRVPYNITAEEIIGIERCFGRNEKQELPIPVMPVSEVNGIGDHAGKNGIEVVGMSDINTFLEVFKLDVGSQLDDSLAKRLFGGTKVDYKC